MRVVRRWALPRLPPDSPEQTLLSIMRITVLVNLFMLGAEVFTEFYTGGSHVSAARYLYFGLHGGAASSRGSGPPSALNVAGAVCC
jgi:hypothetical protein